MESEARENLQYAIEISFVSAGVVLNVRGPLDVNLVFSHKPQSMRWTKIKYRSKPGELSKLPIMFWLAVNCIESTFFHVNSSRSFSFLFFLLFKTNRLLLVFFLDLPAAGTTIVVKSSASSICTTTSLRNALRCRRRSKRKRFKSFAHTIFQVPNAHRTNYELYLDYKRTTLIIKRKKYLQVKLCWVCAWSFLRYWDGWGFSPRREWVALFVVRPNREIFAVSFFLPNSTFTFCQPNNQ